MSTCRCGNALPAYSGRGRYPIHCSPRCRREAEAPHSGTVTLTAASVHWAQRLLAEHGPQTSATLAARTGYTRQACRHALDLLAREGLARISYESREGRGRGRRAWLYTLVTADAVSQRGAA